MKIFNRSSLPETIKYNGIEYKYNPLLSAGYNGRQTTSLSTIETQLRLDGGRRVVMVKVLNSKLKGKTDFHGQPYEAIPHFFTTDRK
jgi:hypothetical protein